jgi:spore maturation protein CgeB
MRFVVAQPGAAFSVQDVYAGWVEALRELGQEVVEYRLDERLTFYGAVLIERDGETRKALDAEGAHRLALNGLLADLYRAQPDVLLVISGFFIPRSLYELVRARGTKVVLIHTESPYEDERQAAVAEWVDLNLVNDPTNISRFPKGTQYVPHAYRPSLHTPGPAVPDLVCDLGFVGTGFPSRIDFFERMNLTGLDVLLAGNWQALQEGSSLWPFLANDVEDCVDNSDAVDVYRSSKCGINIYRREAQAEDLVKGWAMGPREVEMAAAGLFFLRDPRPEGDEVFPMLPTFASPEDAGEQLRWWLDHEDERVELARKAREAIADRTFTAHAAKLLSLLSAG